MNNYNTLLFHRHDSVIQHQKYLLGACSGTPFVAIENILYHPKLKETSEYGLVEFILVTTFLEVLQFKKYTYEEL